MQFEPVFWMLEGDTEEIRQFGFQSIITTTNIETGLFSSW